MTMIFKRHGLVAQWPRMCRDDVGDLHRLGRHRRCRNADRHGSCSRSGPALGWDVSCINDPAGWSIAQEVLQRGIRDARCC